jgi:hypothetical protein
MTNKCDVGGNGGAGGTSTAKWLTSTAPSRARMAHSASIGRAMGSMWQLPEFQRHRRQLVEFIAGTLRNNGSSAPEHVIVVHSAGCPTQDQPWTTEVIHALLCVSACPTPLGTLTISNSGTGSFAWQMSTLPAWLSASKTSGSAGDTINLFFTCTGYSANMSTTVSITGTNSATGQALPTAASLPVSGAVN